MRKLEQISPKPLLLVTIVACSVPFFAVELFKSQLYTVIDISSYLVFHNIVELFSVMVSFSIFGLGWYAYDQNNDRHSFFLCVAFLAIGLIDFMHTLGYHGMPQLITPNPTNKATQFWIAARFFSAAAFLASAFNIATKTSLRFSKVFLLLVALAISSVTFVAINFYPEHLPTAFVQGIGLTPFKKVSEYVIILFLVLASIMYWQRLVKTGDRLINYYLSAFVICIFSELVFTLYKSAFDTFNMLGHIYKTVAFMLIYKGIFGASVRKPYEDLNQSSKMLSHIINSIPQSLFWKNKDSVYQGCNQVFAQQAGLKTLYEIEGLSDFDLPWSREESEAYRADDRYVMDNVKAKYHIVEPQHRADGTTIWLDTTKVPLTDNTGAVSGVLGIYEDITKRKLSEEELHQALHFNQQIIDCAQEGIIVYDLELRYQVWNPFMEQITGVMSADVLGKTPLDVFPFLSDSGLLERLNTILKSGKPDSIEYPFDLPATGKKGWTFDRSAPLFNASGEVIGIIGTVRDTTEERAAERKLQQAQKMESVGRLAGGVAHDFNNMLTIIMGNAHLAMMKSDSSSPLFHHLEEIINASDRAASVTKQLLAFSRQQVVEPKILDLNDAISSMLKMLQRLLGEDIELIWNPAHELMKVKIDPSQLDQILANLCVNARDAISGVGRIVIQVENFTLDETGWEEGADNSPGNYVMLAVSDNGSGISKDVIDHIFEPFYTTKTLGKGTGLGLAMVYGIVKQHGGYIRVYSELGYGTTFRIYLPCVTGSVENVEREKRDYVGGNETILVVEDEIAILRLATNMLEKLGYAVLQANSPEEALSIASDYQGRINLLLTDTIMPGMNGRDLSEKLLLSDPSMKCLFMSGYTADVMADRGRLGNNMFFMHKPFNMDLLSTKVREALTSD